MQRPAEMAEAAAADAAIFEHTIKIFEPNARLAENFTPMQMSRKSWACSSWRCLSLASSGLTDDHLSAGFRRIGLSPCACGLPRFERHDAFRPRRPHDGRGPEPLQDPRHLRQDADWPRLVRPFRLEIRGLIEIDCKRWTVDGFPISLNDFQIDIRAADNKAPD
jgi:hypothetical protein